MATARLSRWTKFAMLAVLPCAACGGSGSGGGGPDPSTALASLVLSAGILSPSFAPDTMAYNVGPGLLPAVVTLKPTAAAVGATIQVDGTAVASGSESGPIDLAIGLTLVPITVRSPSGGSMRTYSIAFLRQLGPVPGYLKASNADAGDAFGASMAIDGDTLVVTAPLEASDGSSQADDSELGAGAAYVFVRSGSGWVQQAYLKASNPQGGDFFGMGVAISGDTIVVTAPWEDSKSASVPDEGAPDSGAAYVFVRVGTTWSQQAYLKASNPDPGDEFGGGLVGGHHVALSGDTLAVGAPDEDGHLNAAADSGAVYVFVRNAGVWEQQALLRASNPDPGDQFGMAVALHQDSVLAGAPFEDGDGTSETDDDTESAGAAYVFVRSGAIWSQQAYLKASIPCLGSYFGSSVGLWGSTAVVGAWGEHGDATLPCSGARFGSGAAFVYERSGGAWSPGQYLKASNLFFNDAFGHSVAIHGDTLVVTSQNEDGDGSSPTDDTLSDAGAAYVFFRTPVGWTEGAYLKALNPDRSDRFGVGVAISGDTVLVGSSAEASDGTSPADDSAPGAGAAYTFR